MSDSKLILATLFSPAYPVGAFAYSHGLEAAVHRGDVRSAGQLQAWLADVLLRGAGRNDAILLAASWRADTDTRPDIADLAEALCSSRERWVETMDQGRAFARVTMTVWGVDLVEQPLPVVAGAAGKALNLPLEELLQFYLHAFAANLVSAGVRFIPLGQTEGQGITANLLPVLAQITDIAMAATLDDLGGAALNADLAAMHHETLPTRIFRT